MAKVPWTEAELNALRREYPSRGAGWRGWGRLLPGRTEKAIRAAAHRLGLRQRRERAPERDEDPSELLGHLAAYMRALARERGEL